MMCTLCNHKKRHPSDVEMMLRIVAGLYFSTVVQECMQMFGGADLTDCHGCCQLFYVVLDDKLFRIPELLSN